MEAEADPAPAATSFPPTSPFDNPFTDAPSHAQSKGKARAADVDQLPGDERTPLLHSTSPHGAHSYTTPHGLGSSRSRSHSTRRGSRSRARVRRRRIVAIFLTFLSLTLFLLLLLVLLIYSYASTALKLSPSTIARHAVVLKPKGADVLNVTEDGGIWVRASLDLGVDADWVMGFRLPDSEVGFVERAWRSIGRWGVRTLGSVSVTTSTISVYPEWSASPDPLTTLSLPPLAVPLTANAPRPHSRGHSSPPSPKPDTATDSDAGPERDTSWLTPMSITAFLKPSQDQDQLSDFLNRSWRSGRLSIRASVPQVQVWGGDPDASTWRGWLSAAREDVDAFLQYPVPQLPGLPPPGSGEPFPPLASLIHLDGYKITTPPGGGSAEIKASASVPNPLPPFLSISLPRLPVEVALVSPSGSISAPISRVTASPEIGHPNISVALTGQILPLSSKTTSFLSSFLSRFLAAKPAPVLLTTPLLPSLHIVATFPAPPERPQILKEVILRGMRLSGVSDGKPLASGEVWAKIVFPRGVGLDVRVKRLWPDVLVYDGEVTHDDVEDGDGSDGEDGDGVEDGNKGDGAKAERWPWHWDWPWHWPHKTHQPAPPSHPNPNPNPPREPHTPTHDDPSQPSQPGDNPDDGDGDNGGNHTPEPMPLPTPLPSKAFARIRPTEWIAARFVDDDEPVPKWDRPPSDGKGGDGDGDDGEEDEDEDVKVVFAKIENVPLDVLPGRESLFRSFVSKVVFSKGGALAGVSGITAIGVSIPGLLAPDVGGEPVYRDDPQVAANLGDAQPRKGGRKGDPDGDEGDDDDDEGEERVLELMGLPFEGKVRVGKRSLWGLGWT